MAPQRSPVVAQQEAEFEMRAGVLRLKDNQAAQVLDCGAALPGLPLCHRQVVKGIRKAGV